MQKSLLVFFLFTMILPRNLWSQSDIDFSDAEVEMLHVSGNVHMLRTNARIGNPSTAVSIGKDGILLVDVSFVPVANKIMSKLWQLGRGDVRFVVNTHWHWDHSWGNEFFGREATVISHSEARKRLVSELLLDDGHILAEDGWPVITLDKSLTIHFNGEEVKILTLPKSGHTDGDVVVYFSVSKVLCVGDYFVVDKFPLIDLDSGGDIAGYFTNIDYLIKTFPADAKVIAGHGHFYPAEIRTYEMQHLQNWADEVKASIAFIRTEMAAGMSLEQIQNQGLPERFKAMGERPRYVRSKVWIAEVFNHYNSIKQ